MHSKFVTCWAKTRHFPQILNLNYFICTGCFQAKLRLLHQGGFTSGLHFIILNYEARLWYYKDAIRLNWHAAQWNTGSEFLSDAPFFGLDLCTQLKTGELSMHEWVELNPWTLKQQPRRWLYLEYPTLSTHFWSCKAVAWDSRGLHKVSAITICIALFPWG